jgi:hypothetical protein
MHANYSKSRPPIRLKTSLFPHRHQQNFFTHPQFATSNTGRGGRRYLPYAFTEHGAIQAANVLNSPRAVEMGIYVVRAFVQLREFLSSNKDLARRLDQLEARIEKKLATHDEAIAAMLSAIRELMNPPAPKRRPIGFTADLTEKS